MQQEQLDYHKVGSLTDIVISNSLLSKINPAQNGSPQKAKKFLEGLEEEKPQLLRGEIFHKWAENPKAFHVAEIDRPSGGLGDVADLLLDVVSKSTGEQIKDLSLDMSWEFNPNLQQFVVDGCKTMNWNPRYGFDALVKNACPSIVPFITEKIKAENEHKIFLTKPQRENLEKCVESLKANKIANELLFYKSEFSNIEYYKEVELYWEERFFRNDKEESVKFKAKLDDLEIDHDNKIIRITDPKTTSGSAHNFRESFDKWHYGRQFYTYKKGVHAVFPKYNQYKFEFRNIAIETNGLFETVVHKWHPMIIESCQKEFWELVERILIGKENGFTQSMEEIKGNGEVKHVYVTV